MRRFPLVLILALAIQVAPSSVASEEDSVTSTSVTFGASYPMTGAASLGTKSYYSGINAYFSYVNENGGVHGRKIQFILKDDMSVPSVAISKGTDFINKDKVFGLISSAPSCASQIATLQSLRLGQRGIPNLFVDCNASLLNQDSEVDPAELYSTTRFNRVSNKDEGSILKNYIDSNLPSQNVLVIYQDDQNATTISEFANNPRVICSLPFAAGSEGIALGSRVTAVCGSKSAVKSGDVLVYSGSATGLGVLIRTFESLSIKLRYFVNTEAFNIDAFQQVGIPKTSIPEIYFLSSTNLISEVNNSSVNSLIAIGQKYSQGAQVDQRFLNGMNAGYIVSHVLAAVGPNLTRERFLKAMDLYGSQFDALGVSERSTSQNLKFTPLGGMLVKYADSKTISVSSVLSVEQGKVVSKTRKIGKFSDKGLPAMVQLLPNSNPTPAATPTPSPTPKVTPAATPTPTPTKIAPTPVPTLDGEEEDPFGKLTLKKDKTRYSISITSNLPEENLQVRATKKGQKAIIFKVTTDEFGNTQFTTTRVLAGYQVSLFFDGQALSTVKAS